MADKKAHDKIVGKESKRLARKDSDKNMFKSADKRESVYSAAAIKIRKQKATKAVENSARHFNSKKNKPKGKK